MGERITAYEPVPKVNTEKLVEEFLNQLLKNGNTDDILIAYKKISSNFCDHLRSELERLANVKNEVAMKFDRIDEVLCFIQSAGSPASPPADDSDFKVNRFQNDPKIKPYKEMQ